MADPIHPHTTKNRYGEDVPRTAGCTCTGDQLNLVGCDCGEEESTESGAETPEFYAPPRAAQSEPALKGSAITPAPIFLVHFNRDYHEWATAHCTREAAVASIAEVFETEAPHDTREFWEEVAESYERGSWKGLTVHTLDTVSLKITAAVGM